MSVFLVSFILASSAFLLSVGLVAGVLPVFYFGAVSLDAVVVLLFYFGAGSLGAVVVLLFFLVLCHWGSRCEMRATGFCFYFLIAH